MNPMQGVSAAPSSELERQLEEQRKPLIGYCYRMLGSPFEAEDAVQETLVLGNGTKRLFNNVPRRTLTLVDTVAFPTGVMVNTYHPSAPDAE
jgi:hypothetical protein